MLRTIDLPVHAGMKLNALRELLGKPVKEHRFVKDRVSYEFVVPGPPRYKESCTVLNKGGLTLYVGEVGEQPAVGNKSEPRRKNADTIAA